MKAAKQTEETLRSQRRKRTLPGTEREDVLYREGIFMPIRRKYFREIKNVRAKIFPGDDDRSDGIISGKRKPEDRPLREVRPPCPGSVGGRRR